MKTSTPYFYIIRHIDSGIMYAGSRHASGCNPDELLTYAGYITSSKLVHKIIQEQGISSFEILRIDTNLDGYSAVDYESSFLEVNNCAHSSDWYNMYNNHGMSLGTEKFKKYMMGTYGYENAMNSALLRDKMYNTKLLRYNNGYFNNHNQIKHTKLIRYGDEHYADRKKTHRTKLKRYGCRYTGIVDKVRRTKLIRYGDTGFNNISQIKQTNMEVYGVENVFQHSSVKEKSKQTKQEKYGNNTYTNPEQMVKTKREKYGNHCEQIVIKLKQTRLEKYGDANYNNIEKQKQTALIKTLKRFGATSKEELQYKIHAIIDENNLINRHNNINFTKLATFFPEYTGAKVYAALRRFYNNHMKSQ